MIIRQRVRQQEDEAAATVNRRTQVRLAVTRWHHAQSPGAPHAVAVPNRARHMQSTGGAHGPHDVPHSCRWCHIQFPGGTTMGTVPRGALCSSHRGHTVSMVCRTVVGSATRSHRGAPRRAAPPIVFHIYSPHGVP